MSNIIKSNICPEFNGYNIQMACQQGHVPKPMAKVMHLPLVDMILLIMIQSELQ